MFPVIPIVLLVSLAHASAAFEVISPDDVEKTNSSAGANILETLIQNNAAVNFAFQPKRNKTNAEHVVNRQHGDINERINQRIKDLLDKKKVLRKNSTEPNVIWVQVKDVGETTSAPAAPTQQRPVPQFFSNAYDKVMHLFSKTKMKSAPDSNIFEIIERSANSSIEQENNEVTTEQGTTDHTEISTMEYPIESINEIAESLINFNGDDQRYTGDDISTIPSTTVQYLPIETFPAESYGHTSQQKVETPDSLPFRVSVPNHYAMLGGQTPAPTTESPLLESRTETVSFTTTTMNPLPWSTRFPTRFGTRPTQTRQTPSRWVLNTKSSILMPRPTPRTNGVNQILQRLNSTKQSATMAALASATQTYIASTPEPVPERNTVGIEALNGVQTFLSQYGVSVKPTQGQFFLQFSKILNFLSLKKDFLQF